jgi:hypothetical protein
MLAQGTCVTAPAAPYRNPIGKRGSSLSGASFCMVTATASGRDQRHLLVGRHELHERAERSDHLNPHCASRRRTLGRWIADGRVVRRELAPAPDPTVEELSLEERLGESRVRTARGRARGIAARIVDRRGLDLGAKVAGEMGSPGAAAGAVDHAVGAARG